jgi:predicted aspartyl protease
MVASLTGRPSSAVTEPNLAALPDTASTGAEEIKLQRNGGGYLVPVAVNGLPPMNFLLDTGSRTVALPAEVVLTLWRIGTLASSDFIGNEVFVLADGRKVPSITFRIRELKVGQHVIHDVVGNLSPALAQPLLGGSFLSRFASWRIDNQRHLLILAEDGIELNR